MPHLDALHWTLAAGLAALLGWAAVTDVMKRQIPNASVLAILGLFVLWALAGAPAGLGSGLVAAAIGFAVGFALFLLKVMGAGDVKLFAAAALFVGVTYLPMFALATALAGGLIAVLSMLSKPKQTLVMFALRGQGDYGRDIPYGVPISIGALLTLWCIATGVSLADLLQSGVERTGGA
jgi:prepilin peptidase CpaA